MLNSVASPHKKCRFELDPFVIVIVFVLVIDQSTCVVNEVLILYSTQPTHAGPCGQIQIYSDAWSMAITFQRISCQVFFITRISHQDWLSYLSSLKPSMNDYEAHFQPFSSSH